MRPVDIVGVGMTVFDRAGDRTRTQLGVDAVGAALHDAGVEPGRLEFGVCATTYGGPLTGQRIVTEAGLSGLPMTNVENACSGGASALHIAWLAVASGHVDVALALGVEKLTSLGRGTLPLDDEDWEGVNGLTMPGLYAMRAQRYLHETVAADVDLALVSVKAKRNGTANPVAGATTRTVTVEEVLGSAPVASPLTLLECCPKTDGAAAAVVAAPGIVASSDVRVLASVLGAGRRTTGFRDMTRSDITERTVARAYSEAGIGAEQVDVAEVHDAFAIAELTYYESLGLAPFGQGFELIRSDETRIGGRVAVNPSGGLLARGHPAAATGLAQVAEVVWQLRGQAGARQHPDARYGVTHTTGGGIWGTDSGACAVHVLGA